MPVNDYPLLSHSVMLTVTRILPLTRDHSKLVSDVLKLHLGQRLGQHIHDLLICGNVLELHNFLLHHITNILVFDLYVLGLIMEQWIL